MTAEAAAGGGSTAWLLEHLVEGYTPCWQQNLGSGEFDAAVCDVGISRWSNYYLEGLRHMTENAPHTSGIYFDGINFGRDTMLRIRRTLDQAVGPAAAIDFHSGNDFSSWGASPAIRYMHMLPFVDSLWFGESFRYNSPADYWLVEISGLPFGLSSDMLGGDCTSSEACRVVSSPNPFRGMIYGMTGRFNEATYASELWHLWDEIDILNTTMVGWFDETPAVRVLTHTSDARLGTAPPQPSNWSGPYPGYLAGCAGPGPGSPPPPCASEPSLAAAQRKCDAMPMAQCSGVTKEGAVYQLRQASLSSVAGGTEMSWARNCSAEPRTCPVSIPPINDAVEATAFVAKGARTLIVIANFGVMDRNVTLEIDWAQLGLTKGSAKLRAPLLNGFVPRGPFGGALPRAPNMQDAAEFDVDSVIPVKGAWGWLLLLEEPQAKGDSRGAASKSDDDAVSLQECAGAAQWTVPALGKSGTVSRRQGGLCLSVKDPVRPRAALVVGVCSDATEQLFTFAADGSIKHTKSGLRVGAEHADTKPGSKCDIDKWDSTDNQRWNVSSSHTIVHKLSGLCLSTNGASPQPSPAPPSVPISPSTLTVGLDRVINVVDAEYVGVAYDTAAWLGIPWENQGATTAPDLADPYLIHVVSHLAPARLRVGGGAGDCQTYLRPPANSSFLSSYCKEKHYYNFVK